MAKPVTPVKLDKPKPAGFGTPNRQASHIQAAKSVATAPPQRPAAKLELKPQSGEPTDQAIAEAAYFLWMQRGGNPTVNWLEAEARLKSQCLG